MPSPDLITVPKWVMHYVIGPVAVGFLTMIWWLGRKIYEDWEEAAATRDEEIEALRSEVRQLKQRLRQQMADDHTEVESLLREIHEEVQS
jgi:F0F1-type ATP synthase membrane subunit b/b'